MSVTGPGPGGADDAVPPLGRFSEDLVGLDPDDPDAQALAARLDRTETSRRGFTVEGYLANVGEFARSANRTAGLRRLIAVGVAVVFLLGVL
ncbi:MAG: hypothetical protein ACXVX9_15015 [Mycobacteriaceae bacterium]